METALSSVMKIHHLGQEHLVRLLVDMEEEVEDPQGGESVLCVIS